MLLCVSLKKFKVQSLRLSIGILNFERLTFLTGTLIGAGLRSFAQFANNFFYTIFVVLYNDKKVSI